MLDEFYRNLRHVSVSAATGEGIKELMEQIDEAAKEYDRDYLPELKRRKVFTCVSAFSVYFLFSHIPILFPNK